MSKSSSFTGRRRRRTTRAGVRLADRLAHIFITIGGIGTILAVLGILAFLLWVVMPLFLPAGVDEEAAFSTVARLDEAIHVGMDEYQLLGWALLPQGEVIAYRLDNGEIRDRQRPFGDRVPLAVSFPVGEEKAAFGFADGSVQLAGIGFATSFVPEDDLTGEEREAVTAAPDHAGVNLRRGVAGLTPQGQVRLQELHIDREEPVVLAAGPVALVSMVVRPTGPFLVALALEPGGAVLKAAAGREEEDFLTGESRMVFATPVMLPLPGGQAASPSFMQVNGPGSDVFLGWENGSLARIHCAPLDDPFVAEIGRLTPAGARLTAMKFILGNGTLIWGDDAGHLRGGFLVPVANAAGVELGEARRDDPRGRKALALSVNLGDHTAPVTALAPSGRSRMVAAGFGDGAIRLLHVTSQRELAEIAPAEDAAVELLAMAPKENGLLAITPAQARHWRVDLGYPEAGFAAMFHPVWYEGYDAPRHVWQSSSGTDDFEAKLGLMPLIFGTLKATIYSMLFGAPLALLAAIFTSEFLDRRARAVVKPGIEMMASLPSVVLGFLAALVFAPLVEAALACILAAFATVPLMFLAGAFLWQMLPVSRAVRMDRWRFPFQLLAVGPGLLLALWVGPLLERRLFAGDLKGWLAWVSDGAGDAAASPYASPFGGWFLLALPVSALLAAVLVNRQVTPRLRATASGWSRGRLGRTDLLKFACGCGLGLLLTLAAASLMTAGGFDPRGGIMDTYVQRNALVVGFVMGFAIIPIIYTIAEDALSTVPQHLRSASLGAGATRWQTAMRIVIPTAMSGISSAIMVGLGRAVGETMVVLMAAGNTPVMSWNVFEGFRTLSANIAVELPEAVRNSTHYRTLFLAALVLFAMTFVVNTVAEIVRLRFRRRAGQL
jgi:phosphate transport system permease protein